MSIESALWTALSGLNATQAQIQVVSGNIANVQTKGYSREILPQQTVVNAASTSVSTGAVQRVVDQVLNSNLRSQITTANAATTLSTYYQQIDSLLGQVGSGATINDALNNFSSALQAVATTPQDPVAQGAAVSAGQTLAQTLNQMSAGIQSIRQGTDLAISTDVGTLNTALQSIASINTQVSQLKAEGKSTAVLEDQRDQALNQVAQLIGVTSFTTADGALMVMTPTGQTLVDGVGAGTFSYTPSGNVNATTALSGIKLDGVDITNDLTNGSIGALRQLRDTDLPGLTAQLNQFTDNLFNATSVPQSGVTFANGGGSPAAGDTFTATVDGQTYTTAGLPANPTMTDIANALNTQFDARTTISVGGGAPQAGDVFTATIDGTNISTTALSGAGPFSTTDIVSALNTALTGAGSTVSASLDAGGNIVLTDSAGNPLTVSLVKSGGTGTETFTSPATMTVGGGAPQAGDVFTATIDGTAISTTALSGSGPFTSSDIVDALNTALTAASSTVSASLNASGNIVFTDSGGNPLTVSLVKSAGTGTETFAATTLSASALNGTISLTDSSGNPVTATLTTNPMFVAGTPNNGSTPTTIDFTQPSGSFNIGQTFDVVVDGTDFGTTIALPTGSATLTGVATAIQNLFTAQGSAFTASVVGGKLEIADPAGNPITASVTLNGGPGSETFSAGVATNPLATLNSGLGATNDANHFFASVDLVNGVDNAATIQVNPSLIANNALLLQGASGPDPTIAQNLFSNLGQNYTFQAAGSFTNSTTTSLGSYSSQIIGQTASTASGAQSNATFQSSLQSQLEGQAGSVSGVNIDEELSNLIQYQNAYSANARVMTVIQTLYDTLMRM